MLGGLSVEVLSKETILYWLIEGQTQFWHVKRC
jgi:predicted metalloprotease with PDZ domain